MRNVMATASLAALVLAIPVSAFAQEDALETLNAGVEEDEARQSTVVVTGSAIRGTPEDAALPVEVFTAEELALEGSPTALKFAKDLTISGPTNGESNYFGGGPLLGSPSFNLRGIGADKTLTLLNGRRMSENLSNIPGIAVARTEVLKDGAAVIYGADAVGGVVNFITRDDFVGYEAQGNYTIIDGSDGDFDLGVMAGFGEGDVNFLVSAEWEHRSRLETEERDFSSLSYADNPLPWSPLTNLANYVARSNTFGTLGLLRDFDQSGCEQQGGVFITGVPTYCSYNYAPFYNLVEEQDIYRIYSQINARVNDKMNFRAEAAYGQVKAPNQFNSPSQPALRGPDPSTGATYQYRVPSTNPYTQEFAARNGFALAGLTDYYDIIVFRPFAHQGNPAMGNGEGNSNAADIDYQVWHVTAGIDGELGDFGGPFQNVGYDFAVTYNGAQTYYQDADYVGFRLQDALNGFGGPNCSVADQDPLTPGVQAPGLEGTGGCEFFNPFSSSYAGNPETGATNPNYIPGTENSDELSRWLFDPLIVETLTQSLTYDLVFNGTTGINLPGGEIGWALGGQARTIEIRDVIPSDLYNGATPCPYPGTLNCPGEFGQGPFGFRGVNEPDNLDQQSYSFFGEVALPILDNLNVQAAARREEFSGDLGATVYKISGKWDVVGPFSLRGSYGTNFTAPPAGLSPGEVNQVVRSYAVAGGNWLGGTTRTRSDVQPEEATSWNVGAIWKSRGFASDHDFSLIIDYFDIEIEGEIDELASHSQIASAFFSGAGGLADCSSPFLGRVSLNASPTTNNNGTCVQGVTTAADLNSVQTDFGNGPDRSTAGFDFQMNYRMPVGSADLAFGLTATRVTEQEASATLLDGVEVAPAADFLGGLNFSSIGFASPKWRANGFVNYNRDSHNVRLTGRYVSSLDDARFANGPLQASGYQPGTTTPFDPIDYGKVDSSFMVDVTYVYEFNENLRLTGTVSNIFDEDPPFVYTEFGYDPRIANPLKRTFELGIKATF
ncbi:TonB-dependent receptor domain-containing protein [Henriciella litoralis]|uniref:TonB-dependent receptor domain-containing protein n=1 Tax=Henriciella litoralis TaxID=568102 RepID=UPI0009FF082B|nr:TonB-dependent receptor [Henriciella litoralis]